MKKTDESDEIWNYSEYVNAWRNLEVKCGTCGTVIHTKDIAYRNGQPVCDKCK